MKVLIDENMSSSRLAARLHSAGHDVLLARDVVLVSIHDESRSESLALIVVRHTNSSEPVHENISVQWVENRLPGTPDPAPALMVGE
jgi:hypothetical protein